MLWFFQAKEALAQALAEALNDLASASADRDYWRDEAFAGRLRLERERTTVKRLEQRLDGYKDVVQQCKVERDDAVKALADFKARASKSGYETHGDYY